MDDRGIAEAPEAEAEIERRARHHDQIRVRERRRARPCERELVIGREHPPAHVVHEHRDTRAFGERAQLGLRARPVDVAADHQDRMARVPDERGDARDRVRIGRRAGERRGIGSRRRGRLDRGPTVERHVEEGRAAVRRARGAERGVERGRDPRGIEAGRRRFRDRRDDRHVVELLERTLTPSRLRCAPTDDQHGRAVEPHARDRAHAVRDTRSRGQRGDADAPGRLREPLGGERRSLLVPGVDQPDPHLHATVVERPDVAAVEREDGVDVVRLQRPGRRHTRRFGAHGDTSRSETNEPVRVAVRVAIRRAAPAAPAP